jgi:hypothetical protein
MTLKTINVIAALPLCYLLSIISNQLIAGELPLAQKEIIGQLKLNQLKVITTKVKDRPWPRITIYSKLKATPGQAMAIFSAFDRQKEFVLDTLESTPIKQLAPNHIIVRYRTKMPWPISSTTYINGHQLEIIEHGYLLTWYQVESEGTKYVEGSMRLLSYLGETVMIYQNLAHPKSIFAGLLKGIMRDKVEETIQGVVNFIEAHTQHHPDDVKQLVDQMEHILIKSDQKSPIKETSK